LHEVLEVQEITELLGVTGSPHVANAGWNMGYVARRVDAKASLE
jgi:hypothetical protein